MLFSFLAEVVDLTKGCSHGVYFEMRLEKQKAWIGQRVGKEEEIFSGLQTGM